MFTDKGRSENTDKIVDFKCTPERLVFNSEEYKIYGCSVNSFEYPDIQIGKYGTCTVKGNVQELNLGVEYMVKAKEECEMDSDELMMIALDAGAEDFSEEEDSFEVVTDPADFSKVRQTLEDAGVKMAQAEVTMIPQNYVTLTDEESIKRMNIIIDRLDEDEDVQQVYHNWDE